MGSPALAPRLRGRETETGALRETLDRVARGGQAIVLVEGEAGIGKTRLLEEALADAVARGMQVATGLPPLGGAAWSLAIEPPPDPGRDRCPVRVHRGRARRAGDRPAARMAAGPPAGE